MQMNEIRQKRSDNYVRVSLGEMLDLIQEITGIRPKYRKIVELLKRPSHSKYWSSRVYVMAYICTISSRFSTIELSELPKRQRDIIRFSANQTIQRFKEPDLQRHAKVLLERFSFLRELKNKNIKK